LNSSCLRFSRVESRKRDSAGAGDEADTEEGQRGD
jgi:hypothetical protein